MVNRKLSVAVIAGLLLSVGVSAQKKDDKKQSERRQKKEIAGRRQAGRRSGGRPDGAERFGAGLGPRRFHEGARQQAIRAVHRHARSAPRRPPATVAFYWRVVSKDAARRPPPVADPKDAKKDDKKNPPKRPEFAYEDISFVPVTPGSDADSHQPVVYGAGRRLRRLRGREGADLHAEERACPRRRPASNRP